MTDAKGTRAAEYSAQEMRLARQICEAFGTHPYLVGLAPRPKLGRLALWWWDFRHRRRIGPNRSPGRSSPPTRRRT